MQDDYRALQREILELKTAQPIPSILNMYPGTLKQAIGRYTGVHRWKIQFKDVGDTNAPIVIAGGGGAFSAYNSANDTQEIFIDYGSQTIPFTSQVSFLVDSTRPILSITQQTTPLPLEEWEQVRDFYPADMGTTAGWCLQNTRLGFHIYSGTYASARADMEAQIANDTLHGGTPPDYIACPIYFANYDYTPLGHVAAWDHGRVYSDGVEYPSISSVADNYMGWGEFCDGARVVEHV